MNENQAEWSHNTLRDHIVNNYYELPKLECRFCKQLTALPVGNEVIPEYSYRVNGTRSRADIAILDTGNNLAAVLEVIDTHPPRDAVFQMHNNLTDKNVEVLYLDTHSLDGDTLSGWCTPGCWQLQDRAVPTQSELTRCGICDCLIPQSEYAIKEFCDWGFDPYTAFCLICAASRHGAQWAEPGSMIRGYEDVNIPMLAAKGDPGAILHWFTKSEFWSNVWRSRIARALTSSNPPEYATHDESATSHRLGVVFTAFTHGYWRVGETLLRGVGAPTWEQEDNLTMYAWRPENCILVAAAWQMLSNHWQNILPEEVRRAIAHRKLPSRCRVCTQYLEYDGTCYNRCEQIPVKPLQEMTHFARPEPVGESVPGPVCETCGESVSSSSIAWQGSGNYHCDKCLLRQLNDKLSRSKEST